MAEFIYTDTDSVYLSFTDCIPDDIKDDRKQINEYLKFLTDNFGNAAIKKTMQNIENDLGALTTGILEADREAIAPTGFFQAKKKYCLMISNMEGVEHETYDMKVMGLDAIRSGTPKYCQAAMKKFYKILLMEGWDEAEEFVREFRKEFQKQDLDKIALITGISDIDKFDNGYGGTVKGTPMHSRAVVSHNNYIKKIGKELEVPAIQEGDKLKYIFLRKPNKTGQDVFAYTEMNDIIEDAIKGKIDYDRLFERTFEKHINIIFKAVGHMRKYNVELDLM